MTNPFPRIMTINDLSGVGKCSLTVALPILSCTGASVAVLPTAILSTHTGGFQGYTYRDLTCDMLSIAAHWHTLGLHFDALYSGWMGSREQADIVSQIFDLFQSPDTLVFVDPVMGDHGKLYSTYTMDRVAGVAALCGKAHLITPNLTEACLLLEEPYTPDPLSPAKAQSLCERLCQMGPTRIVITGISTRDGVIGAAAWDAQTSCFSLHEMPRIPGLWHGTGDIFGSVLLGAITRGQSLARAASLAVDFIYRCIASAHQRDADPRFGVDFETQLPLLMEAITHDKKLDVSAIRRG